MKCYSESTGRTHLPFFSLHPYLVNDIAFGSGRFNVLMGLTASCFGLGGTLSNLLVSASAFVDVPYRVV